MTPKFSLAGALTLAASLFEGLAKHDPSGALANPSSSLPEKANALDAAMEGAADDIVTAGLTAKLGPLGAVAAEAAVPLLNKVIARAQAEVTKLLSSAEAPGEAA